MRSLLRFSEECIRKLSIRGSVGSSVEIVMIVYCENKLRSLNEGEIQTLLEVCEEFIAKILGGPIVSERFVAESMHVDFVGDLEEKGQEYLSLIPAKSVSGVGIVADSSKLPSESPLKLPAGVAFMVSEKEKFMCEVAQSGKRKTKTKDGDGMRSATSSAELTTEIGLSEMD